MITAPAAPQGISQPPINHAGFISMAENNMAVKAVTTPPPSAIST
jgi:hypothetical protein